MDWETGIRHRRSAGCARGRSCGALTGHRRPYVSVRPSYQDRYVPKDTDLAACRRPFAITDAAVRIVSARRLARTVPCIDGILERDRRWLLRMALGRMTEFERHDTFKFGVRYRTAGVVHGPSASINREHVVPLASLLDELVARPDRADSVMDLAVSCVVTVREHEALPPKVPVASAGTATALHSWWSWTPQLRALPGRLGCSDGPAGAESRLDSYVMRRSGSPTLIAGVCLWVCESFWSGRARRCDPGHGSSGWSWDSPRPDATPCEHVCGPPSG